MHETGHSKPVHWDNAEEWDGEGAGRGIQDGAHIYGISKHGNNDPICETAKETQR